MSSLLKLKSLRKKLLEKKGNSEGIEERGGYQSRYYYGSHSKVDWTERASVNINLEGFSGDRVLSIPSLLVYLMTEFSNIVLFNGDVLDVTEIVKIFVKEDNLRTRFFESIGLLTVAECSNAELLVMYNSSSVNDGITKGVMNISDEFLFNNIKDVLIPCRLANSIKRKCLVLFEKELLFAKDVEADQCDRMVVSKDIEFDNYETDNLLLTDCLENMCYLDYIDQFPGDLCVIPSGVTWMKRLLSEGMCMSPVPRSECLYKRVRSAVALHVGSSKTLAKILKYFKNLVTEWDLWCYITIASDARVSEKLIKDIDHRTLRFKHVIVSDVNKGMDIYGNLRNLKEIYNSGEHYDQIYMLHTKTDDVWRDNMLKPILGSPMAVIRSEVLMKTPKIGIIASKNMIISQSMKYHSYHLGNLLTLENIEFDHTSSNVHTFTGGTIFVLSWSYMKVMMEFYTNNINYINSCFNDRSTTDLQYVWNLARISNKTTGFMPESIGSIDCSEYPEIPKNMFLNKSLTEVRDYMFEHSFERFWGVYGNYMGYDIKGVL